MDLIKLQPIILRSEKCSPENWKSLRDEMYLVRAYAIGNAKGGTEPEWIKDFGNEHYVISLTHNTEWQKTLSSVLVIEDITYKSRNILFKIQIPCVYGKNIYSTSFTAFNSPGYYEGNNLDAFHILDNIFKEQFPDKAYESIIISKGYGDISFQHIRFIFDKEESTMHFDGLQLSDLVNGKRYQCTITFKVRFVILKNNEVNPVMNIAVIRVHPTEQFDNTQLLDFNE